MTPARPDTEDTPPAHPRRASGERNEIMPEHPRFWTGETVMAALSIGVFIAGAIIALAGHAYVLGDHVSQLDASYAKHLEDVAAQRRQNEARMTAVEANVAANAAAADKSEALLRQELQSINDKLDGLQKSVDHLPHH